MEREHSKDIQNEIAYYRAAEGFYSTMAAAYLYELTEEQIEALAKIDFSSMAIEESSTAFDSLERYLQRRGPNARQDLAVDYARIFLAAGVYEGKTAVPYESVFTSPEGILMQDSRDEVLACYRSHGLTVDGELHMPEDHLGFELEFMALLSREIAEAIEAKQKDEGTSGEPLSDLLSEQISFIDSHLLNWVPDLLERIEDFAELPFYTSLTAVVIEYIRFNRSLNASIAESLKD